MAISKELLLIIARNNPILYEIIFPRGPVFRARSRVSEVTLNPQPLPPHEIGAMLATEFVQAIYFANRFGLDPRVIFDDLDDWCPTIPRRIKLPPWWPPIPEPEPEPDWLSGLHLGFAAKLATVDTGDSPLSDTVNRALERSMSALEKLTG
jgi:hypothetical protein